MKLRLMTYNIHGARGVDGTRNYRRIGEYLKQINVDVALIQEIDTRPKDIDPVQMVLDLKADHFSFFSAAPTLQSPGGWYGNGILSKFPISKERIIDISAPGREPRNILEVYLETPLGLLHVVNTHKGLHPFERGRQMRRLNELLTEKSDVPLVVGGDINEWQTYSGALRRLNQLLHPMKVSASFPTRLPILHLDRLWCRPRHLFQMACTLKSAETRIYSDHYPILAEIDLSKMLSEMETRP